MSKTEKYETEKFVPTTEEVFKLPLLSLLENHEFFIKRVEFDKSLKGEYAVLDIIQDIEKPEIELYRTSGTALINQLKPIRERLEESGKLQAVRLEKVAGKNHDYLAFVDF